ncbi:hypothetical protein [Streptosporangium sp. NPDC051022]|uniref:hypothetical protein n=1 Tax=Streptosporangium sp. NPDC051022 TaxID=3155752 RepID=UPI00341B2436
MTKDDLNDALAMVASFQGYVQHADGKVSTLVVLHAGAAATVASQVPAGLQPGQAGGAAGAVLLCLFLLGFLVSGYHMLQAVRPVLRPPAIRSRYGVAGRGPSAPNEVSRSIPARIAEARAMAELLAAIAERKYRHVSRAVPWTGLMLGSAICWLALVVMWR